MPNTQKPLPQYLTFPLDADSLKLSARFEGRLMQDPFGDLNPKVDAPKATK